jgi:signal peptide peptidase SppA
MHPLLRGIAADWSIEADSLRALADQAALVASGPFDRVTRALNGERVLEAEINGSRATIPVRGVLMASVPWWMHYLGLAAVDLGELRSVIDELAADPGRVTEIVLSIDSPGGTVAGTLEAAGSIRRARESGLSITAQCAGMCCSGAYWLASQCDSISATPTTIVGSIGVYTLLLDDSAAQESAGVRVHLVSSGGVKGAGADGRVSPALLAETQARIDELAELFRRAVGLGRSMAADQVAGLATGRVWLAESAASAGLIDAIDDALGAYAPADDDDEEEDAKDDDDDTPTPDEDDDDSAAATPPQPRTQEASSMEPKDLTALLKAHPAHASLIAQAFDDGIDRAACLEQIIAAERTRADSATANAESATAAQAFAAACGSIPDPGADAAGGELLSDSALRQEWAALSPANKAAYANSFESFQYCRLNALDPAKT